MWWGQVPPWMQGMGQGQGQGQMMTPGAGMPPYGRAPMNMTPPQMTPPNMLQSAAPPQAQQPPLNPMQMGMLSGLLSQQTQKPAVPKGVDPNGRPLPPVAAPGTPPAAAAAAPSNMQVTPEMLGWLRQVAPGMFAQDFNWG